MRLYEVNSYSELLSLEEKWNILLERAPHSIFSTWDWISIWWKHFGRNKKLILLVAEENNMIFGIAPLMYSVNSLFGAKRGKIEFIGTPNSDYNTFIIAEKKEDFLKLIIDYLNKLPEKWEFLDLKEIPQDADYLPYLYPISKSVKPTENCPYLPLPNSFDTFMNSLSYKKRKYVRRGLRKLESNFKVEFVDYSQIDKYSEGMNCLFELHKKKWNSEGQSGVLADKDVQNFHLEIANIFSRKNWLCLNILKLSGIPVAVEYGFKLKSRYYAYLPGVNPKYYQYSAGNMLFIFIVKQLIEDGISVYDFLRGAEKYKDYWNGISKFNYEITIAHAGPFAGSRHWWFNKYWIFASALRYRKLL